MENSNLVTNYDFEPFSQITDTARVLPQRHGETDAFYARRLIDPLEIVTMETEQRMQLVNQSKVNLREALQGGNAKEIIELSTDIAYRSVGNPNTQDTRMAVKLGVDTLDNELVQNASLDPLQRLSLETRRLDLMSIRHMTDYLQVKTLGDSTKTSNALKLLEAASKTAVDEGINLLQRAQESHTHSVKDNERIGLRGKMFELLYITFSRLKIYEDELYDSQIVLGSTQFEDAAASHFKPRNHNYDVLVLSSSGEVENVVQCKNAHDDTPYATPIEKIEGQSFSRFVNSPTEFITALRQLASNSAGLSERQMREDQAMLESLFTHQSKETEDKLVLV